MNCTGCQATLDGYDIGAYRKLIHREAKTFLCRGCLAKELGWSREYLEQNIALYIKQGCTLFPAEKINEKGRELQ